MTTWLYFFNATSDDGSEGTMHLADFDDYHKALFANEPTHNLCGTDTKTMTEIDETASGFLVTCKTCRSIAGIDKRPR
jgi:hypothetical protein